MPSQADKPAARGSTGSADVAPAALGAAGSVEVMTAAVGSAGSSEVTLAALGSDGSAEVMPAAPALAVPAAAVRTPFAAPGAQKFAAGVRPPNVLGLTSFGSVIEVPAPVKLASFGSIVEQPAADGKPEMAPPATTAAAVGAAAVVAAGAAATALPTPQWLATGGGYANAGKADGPGASDVFPPSPPAPAQPPAGDVEMGDMMALDLSCSEGFTEGFSLGFTRGFGSGQGSLLRGASLQGGWADVTFEDVDGGAGKESPFALMSLSISGGASPMHFD